MREAIAWSHDLFSPDEQRLFRRLAVFAGGFTVAAAETVCADPDGSSGAPSVLSGIASLADKSLVQQVGRPEGAPRLRMLDTIREFGQEQLAVAGETEATMERLVVWCQALLVGSRGVLHLSATGWVEPPETEHDNLRAALAWAIQRGDAVLAQRLVENLIRVRIPCGYFLEARNWGERALALGDRVTDSRTGGGSREDGRSGLAAG